MVGLAGYPHRGLEAVITLHAANNLLAFGLAAGFGELASTETAADAPWQAMVVEFVFAPLYCLVVAWMAKRRGLSGSAPEVALSVALSPGRPPGVPVGRLALSAAAVHPCTPAEPYAAPATGPRPKRPVSELHGQLRPDVGAQHTRHVRRAVADQPLDLEAVHQGDELLGGGRRVGAGP